MLRSLTIRHIALIDRLSLDFAEGFTTLTGETGAGKSILIDAIGLIRGDRAQAQLIMAGQEEAEVLAEFSYAPDSPVAQFLREESLMDEEAADTLLIRRTITRDGRGKVWLNGRQCPLAQLKTLGALLIDVHGQHHNQKLLHKTEQRATLDGHAGLDRAVDALARTAQSLHRAEHQLAEREAAAATRADRRALLAFQLEEIDAINPEPDEFNQQHQLLSRLSRQDEWRNTLHEQIAQLYEGENSVHDRLSAAQHALERLVALDDRLSAIVESLASAAIEVSESAHSLRDQLDADDADPGLLDRVQQRLDSLHQLARKHRIAPEFLDEHIAALRREAEQLASEDAAEDNLSTEITRLRAEYDRQAAEIRAQRQAAATGLAAAVSAAIQQLGMPHGRIEIAVTPSPQAENRPEAGIDEVQFLISANRGHPLQPLNEIASGGELARVSLAFKTLTAAFDPVQTFIFDEVDTGIGGAIAEIVGRHLRALGQHRQVLCVTHLPQVAAQGQHQIQVAKTHHEAGTRTTIAPLSASERIEEIARMIGGVEITEQTRRLATEMLNPPNLRPAD
ncbi:DNA repair protein RecN [Halothiobacillus sp. DCM-1]|uniref:DNA repair protein RecN n=1 Tax=Halothiobacillus sp. DCM-1 TaxID=3112558 RepID=UPI0032565C70